jgi:hypothetical protein
VSRGDAAGKNLDAASHGRETTMKKYLILSALAILTAVSTAAAQSDSFETSVDRSLPQKPQPAPPITIPGTGGVFQVAIRQGNPLQMLNPMAPSKYGTADEHATHDPKDPGKPKGIKFFEWTF